MLFTSRKDLFFKILFGSIILLLAFIATLAIINFQYIPFVIVILTTGLFLWIWFDTYYVLSNSYLEYRSGPIRGKIALADIVEIELNKTMYVGLKPATARNGVIIKYGRFNEIYISPKDSKKFVHQLLKLNPNIKVN